MFAWRPPLLMLFLLALGRGLPSSAQLFLLLCAGGRAHLYLSDAGRDV